MTSSARIRLAMMLGTLVLVPGLSAQGNRPESHTVRSGDTLWDLARQYLGDPFLWPEIYRLNTNVVEDPHWIYPDEVLRLSGSAEVSAVPAQDTPVPPEPAAPDQPVEAEAVPNPAPAVADNPDQAAAVANPDQAAAAESPEPPPAAAAGLAEPMVGDLTGDDTLASAGGEVDMTPLVGTGTVKPTGPSLELGLARNYRPLRRSEFFSAGFLTEDRPLPMGRLLGLVTPLEIKEVSTRTTAQMYSKVGIVPPAGAKYQVGDTLLVVILGRRITGFGNVIEPQGLLRVIDVSRPENLAEVIAAYGPLRDNQLLLPAETFMDPGNVHAVPISDGVHGQVLGLKGDAPLTSTQDIIFLDKGRADGVAIGDVFELRQTPRDRPGGAAVVNQVMATTQIVHVGEHHATAKVLRVAQAGVHSGIEARQIAKLPS